MCRYSYIRYENVQYQGEARAKPRRGFKFHCKNTKEASTVYMECGALYPVNSPPHKFACRFLKEEFFPHMPRFLNGFTVCGRREERKEGNKCLLVDVFSWLSFFPSHYLPMWNEAACPRVIDSGTHTAHKQSHRKPEHFQMGRWNMDGSNLPLRLCFPYAISALNNNIAALSFQPIGGEWHYKAHSYYAIW